VASQRPDTCSATKAWLRSLEMTTPIAGNPTRTSPVAVEELAERFSDAPARLPAAATLSFHTLLDRPTLPGLTGSRRAMRSAR
jgi:hypothetical protein